MKKSPAILQVAEVLPFLQVADGLPSRSEQGTDRHSYAPGFIDLIDFVVYIVGAFSMFALRQK